MKLRTSVIAGAVLAAACGLTATASAAPGSSAVQSGCRIQESSQSTHAGAPDCGGCRIKESARTDVPASTPPCGASMTVSTKSVVIGSKVTVRGTGCFAANNQPLIVQIALFSGTKWVDGAGATPATNGTWSASFKPSRVGNYKVEASCDNYVSNFSYTPVSFTVRPPLVATKLSISSKPSRGVVKVMGTLTGRAGHRLGGQVVLLQRHTTRGWAKIRSVRTTRTGGLQVSLSKARGWVVRWSYAGSTKYRGSTSAARHL